MPKSDPTTSVEIEASLGLIRSLRYVTAVARDIASHQQGRGSNDVPHREAAMANVDAVESMTSSLAAQLGVADLVDKREGATSAGRELVYLCRMCGNKYAEEPLDGFDEKAADYIHGGIVPEERDMFAVHACVGGGRGIADLVGERQAVPK